MAVGGIGRQLGATGQDFQKRVARLTAGRLLAADNPASQALGERLQAQRLGTGAAIQNTQQGASLIRTAESGLSNTADLLGRARELAVRAANGTVDAGERAALQTEFDQVVQEIDRQAASTQFNGRQLLDGSSSGLQLYAGPNNLGDDQISLALPSVTSASLGLSGANLNSQADALSAVDTVDQALSTVSGARADLGAQQERLEQTETRLGRAEEELTAARSRAVDADFAAELREALLDQIKQQANVALLAQGNVAARGVLRLLGQPG